MYTISISHSAAQGKAQELRAALEEHTKASNAAGGTYALQLSPYNHEPVLINTIWYDSLADREAYQTATANDKEAQARRNKIGEFLARPQTQELHEVLVPATPSGEVKYILRVTYFPSGGKGPELRQALEERVKGRGSVPGTVGAALVTQVAPEAANFSINVLFPSLAGLEEWRSSLQSDKSFQTLQAKLRDLQDRNSRQELMHVLIPRPM